MPFPFTHQHDAMDCGPACLQMIAKHYGKHYRLESLRDNCFLTRERVSMLGISEAAEKIGFRTTGVFDKVAKENSIFVIFEQKIMEEAKQKIKRERSENSEQNASMQKRIMEWLSEENLQKAKGKTREQLFREFGNKLEPVAYISPEYLQYLGENIKDNNVYSGKGYFIDHAVNRTLVFHKSFFNQRKNSYAKYKSVRVVLSLVGGHSTISHSGNPESASALSGRNDDAKVKNNFEPIKKNLAIQK